MKICASACLLGRPCRWDGAAKPGDLSAYRGAAWIPFCPEEAAGLGCPRPPIELVAGADGAVRALRVDRAGDATAALRAACEREAARLARAGAPDLFLLKDRSPSCGLAAPLHDEAGRTIGRAPGLWAALLRERFPDVPVREAPAAAPPERNPTT